MAAKKWPTPDPYPDYRDGNCRDGSGQIVPCGDASAVSPPKWPEDDEVTGDEDDDA